MTPATYTAEQFFGLLGVSTWAGYESVRRGDCPIEPIRVGRRLVWPKAPVDRLLGLENDVSGPARPLIATTLTPNATTAERDHHGSYT